MTLNKRAERRLIAPRYKAGEKFAIGQQGYFRLDQRADMVDDRLQPRAAHTLL